MSEYSVSYSAVQTWRKCPKEYEYRYLMGYRPKVDAAALQLGSILHKYLEAYYRCIQEGLQPRMAHRRAMTEMQNEYSTVTEIAAAVAHEMSEDEEVVAELLELVPKATRIAERYYTVRGRDDAKEYEVLHVESFTRPVLYETTEDRVVGPGRLDLLVRDSAGVVELWDHKTTQNIPSGTVRMRDFQLLYYAASVEELFGIKPERLVWNYLRTKEPTVPKILTSGKNKGKLSQAKNMDTSALTYEAAIKEHDLKVADHEEILDHYADREETVFFPRVPMPVTQSESVLLGDMLISASQIVHAHKQYGQTGHALAAVRSVAPHCDWCSMRKPCMAEIAGDDAAELLEREYKVERAVPVLGAVSAAAVTTATGTGPGSSNEEEQVSAAADSEEWTTRLSPQPPSNLPVLEL